MSRRAGAQWRSHAKADEEELQVWEAATYEEWMGMVRMGEGEEAGLAVSFWMFHFYLVLLMGCEQELWILL